MFTIECCSWTLSIARPIKPEIASNFYLSYSETYWKFFLFMNYTTPRGFSRSISVNNARFLSSSDLSDLRSSMPAYFRSSCSRDKLSLMWPKTGPIMKFFMSFCDVWLSTSCWNVLALCRLLETTISLVLSTCPLIPKFDGNEIRLVSRYWSSSSWISASSSGLMFFKVRPFYRYWSFTHSSCSSWVSSLIVKIRSFLVSLSISPHSSKPKNSGR